MLKLIGEIVGLALTLLAVVGFLSSLKVASPKVRLQFLAAAAIGLFLYGAARTLVPGGETLTLVGCALLSLALFVWIVVLFGQAHGFSVFGWLQSHKADDNLKDELVTAKGVAVDTLKTDATVAKVVAVAEVKDVGGAAASAAVKAVASGAEQAVANAITPAK